MRRKLFSLSALLLTPLLLITMQTASAIPPDPGLELHWDLDEGSGSTAIDDSGHNNDGTLYNNPTYVPGHNNLGVLLDGNNQYIQVDNPLASLGTVNQPYALSAWVNVAAGCNAWKHHPHIIKSSW